MASGRYAFAIEYLFGCQIDSSLVHVCMNESNVQPPFGPSSEGPQSVIRPAGELSEVVTVHDHPK